MHNYKNVLIGLAIIPLAWVSQLSANTILARNHVVVLQSSLCEDGGSGCAMGAIYNAAGVQLVTLCIDQSCRQAPPGPISTPGLRCMKDTTLFTDATVCTCSGIPPGQLNCVGFEDTSAAGAGEFKCTRVECKDITGQPIGDCVRTVYFMGGAGAKRRCCICITV